jgi:hypothetical protein
MNANLGLHPNDNATCVLHEMHAFGGAKEMSKMKQMDAILLHPASFHGSFVA